jgi:hypothetical protein
MFVFYATIETATWAVPSESLQGVRRVPMAKFTALLLAASVLVLSIALLYLGGETRHIRKQPPWQERLFVRVLPH